MPIYIQEGNILEQQVAEAVVVPVNCVGVAGKGLALEFKKKYPKWYDSYSFDCVLGVSPGMIRLHEEVNDTILSILSFPTKDHWRNPSKIEWIKTGLIQLVHTCQEYKIKSIAIPALGCGLGGLNWDDVYPLIVEAFSIIPDDDITLYIYPPQ